MQLGMMDLGRVVAICITFVIPVTFQHAISPSGHFPSDCVAMELLPHILAQAHGDVRAPMPKPYL